MMETGEPRPAGGPPVPGLYTELRRIARRYMAGERAGHTLEPTALVHEALLKLHGANHALEGQDRRVVLARVARAMRLTLVDHARRRGAAKRGRGGQRLPLDDAIAAYERSVPDMVAFDEALERMAALDPQLAEIVELRFFGGLTNEETAESLGTSVSSVVRGWRFARLWLHSALRDED